MITPRNAPPIGKKVIVGTDVTEGREQSRLPTKPEPRPRMTPMPHGLPTKPVPRPRVTPMPSPVTPGGPKPIPRDVLIGVGSKHPRPGIGKSDGVRPTPFKARHTAAEREKFHKLMQGAASGRMKRMKMKKFYPGQRPLPKN